MDVEYSQSSKNQASQERIRELETTIGRLRARMDQERVDQWYNSDQEWSNPGQWREYGAQAIPPQTLTMHQISPDQQGRQLPGIQHSYPSQEVQLSRGYHQQRYPLERGYSVNHR